MNSVELLPSIVKIVSALAVTIGAIIFVSYWFKKIINKSGMNINNSELIKILSVKYLGPKNRIMLIDVSEHIMLIGVTASNISLLTEIGDSKSLEILKDVQGQQEKPPHFSDYFKGMLKGAKQ